MPRDLHPESLDTPMVWRFGMHVPCVHPRAFVHPTATLIGDVQIGAGSTSLPAPCYAAIKGKSASSATPTFRTTA